MKVIRPYDAPFSSSIAEPDIASGEAVYSYENKSVFNFDGAEFIGSTAAMGASDINGFAAMQGDNAQNKVINRVSSSGVGKLTVKYALTGKINIDEIPNVTGTASNGDVIIITSNNTENLVHVSDDGGFTFESLTIITSDLPSGNSLLHVIYNDIEDRFYASKAGVVMYTNDGSVWYNSNNDDLTLYDDSSELHYDGVNLSVVSKDAYKRKRNNNDWDTGVPTGLSNVTKLITKSANQGNMYAFAIHYGNQSIYHSANGGADFSRVSSLGFLSYSDLENATYQCVGTLCFISGNGSYIYKINVNGLVSEVRTELSFDSMTSMSYNSGTGSITCATSAGYVFMINDINSTTAKLVDIGVGVAKVILNSGDISMIISDNAIYPISSKVSVMYGSYNADSGGRSSGGFVDYYSFNGSEYINVNYASSVFYTGTGKDTFKIKNGLFSGGGYGGCASNGQYLFCLIKDIDTWALFRVNLSTRQVDTLDFDVDTSGEISDVSATRPRMTITSEGLIITLNKNLSYGLFDAILRISTELEIIGDYTLPETYESRLYGLSLFADDSVSFLIGDNTYRLKTDDTYETTDSYFEGDELISTDTHRKYRATTTTKDTPENGVNKTPPTWTDIGPTNQYSMYDIYTHNKSVANGEQLTVTLQLSGSQDSIGFFGLENVTNIDITNNSDFDESYDLIDYEATIKTGETELLDSLVVVGKFEGSQELVFTLTSNNTEAPPALGRVLVGRAVELGVTQYGATLGIEDFSKRERDEFGNFTINQREVAKNLDFDVKINKDEVNFVFKYLSKLTTTPCVFIGDDEDSAVQIYGFYSDYTNNIDYPSITSATISVEGLT